MSDFDRNYATATRGARVDQAAVDAGLRAHMISVYNYMAAAVALSGVTAWLAYQAAGGDAIVRSAGRVSGLTGFGQFIFSMPGQIVLLVGTVGLVFGIGWMINRITAATALMLFMLYAGLVGVMLSSVLLVYTGQSVVRVFFISAATFGALSLYGYTTKRDLSGFGSFLMMGVIGILIASVVNIFLQSSMMSFIISVIGVLVFAGLTAYDTQSIKDQYDVMDDGTVAGRKVVMGALNLYLDLINIFVFMLQLVGDRR
jgi:FtsH-binding integral membrane protein